MKIGQVVSEELFFSNIMILYSRPRWQLDACPTGDQEVAELTLPDQQHSFMEIDHDIFYTVILSLPLVQEGQLSVSGKRMSTILVNCLEDKACVVN